MSVSDFLSLRSHHPHVSFTNFSSQLHSSDLELSFTYDIANLTSFTHRVVFSDIDTTAYQQLQKTHPQFIDNLIINIGLIELFSYWKLTCSPLIDIQVASLPPEALAFWQKLLIKGMGEYFYVNNITDFAVPDFVRWQSSETLDTLLCSSWRAEGDPQKESPPVKTKLSSIDFNLTKAVPELVSSESPSPETKSSQIQNHHRGKFCSPPLVGFAGGKDSLLSALLLKNNFSALIVHPASPSAQNTALALDPALPLHHVHRHFDPQLFELNRQGFLNGHVPFSASLAFLANLSQALGGYSSFIVSNEHSASEDSLIFQNQPINHQYSKSLEFERDFNTYVHQFISPHLHYFSLLRPFHELKIAQLFAQLSLPEHLSVFRSCNIGQKENTWCHHCPKCLFVFLILYPFLDETTLTTQIFSRNLFADDSLLPFARELAGLTDSKPLECIGTIEEVCCAFYLSINKYLSQSRPLPPMLALIKEQIIDPQTSWDERAQAILSSYQTDSPLPSWATRLTYPLANMHHLSHLSSQPTLILGAGREGLSLYHFLRTYFPRLPLTIADQKPLSKWGDQWKQILLDDHDLTTIDGDNYLGDLSSFPVIFRSPGIPLSLIGERLEKEMGNLSSIDFASDESRARTGIVESGWRAEGDPQKELAATANNFFGGGATTGPASHRSKTNRGQLCLTSATSIFLQLFSSQIIGTTGTKGKSTTASLIHHLLKESGLPTILVGNIGTPALNHLSSITPDTIIVMELSSHQLQDLSLSPHIAVIQDINPEHLDYYPDFAAYVAAKAPITAHQSPDDYVIFNPNFTRPSQLAASSLAQKVPLSLADLPPSSLRGEHNLQNIAAAVTVAKLFSLTSDQISRALTTFSPLEHRLQFIKTVNGADFYNDSLATTPEATIAAIKSFPDRPLILLAGGYERHQDYRALATTILEHNVPAVILFPTTGERLREEIENLSSMTGPASRQSVIKTPQFFPATSLPEAFSLLPPLLKKYPSSVVLLSPAAASFNLWPDYAARGRSFISAVNQL
ncbi:UDP-N-acetylmuramoyl-L-alanine--D-glutamate ligase [Microgenomates group bacterium]|nr:UDP-N-acetylmuramoyl-L-alanine--D-glutamate ligase [Microgenomates group bacterium]